MNSAKARLIPLIGYCTIVLAGFLMMLRQLNKQAAAHGGHNLQILFVPAIFLFAIGMGLLMKYE